MERKRNSNPRRCILCGDLIIGSVHDARPEASGKCCDKCHGKYVVPARMKNHRIGLPAY